MIQHSMINITEGWFRTGDGTQLRYRIWLPPRPDCVVLLVHGAGEQLEIYEHLGHRFCQEGLAFIAFDLRGFGRSGGKPGHVTYFQEYLDDVDQLIHYYKRKLGNIPFHLIGHSLGGLIVARYAQHHPDSVNKVVLSAPALGLRFYIPKSLNRLMYIVSKATPFLSFDPNRLMKKAQRIPKLNKMINDFIGDDKKDNENIIDKQIPLRRYSIRWVHELLIHTKEALKYAEKLMVPTLCLCGDKDPLIHLDRVHSFFHRLASEDKKWILIPDTGHCLLHSNQPPMVTETLIGWLRKQM